MRDENQQLPVWAKQTTLMKRGAAAYVRMSTEHQKYSTANQLRTISEYAANNELSIVQVYSDEGISGLHIRKRFGLQKLLSDVVRGDAKFDTVLVYDISRWGRFQDPDQSAHYEYLCRMSGVDVVYCAELFQGDYSPMAAVYKSIRRVEAADFSRDLSVRIFKAACHLASRGHSLGGRPKYGLRHVLVGDDGKPIKKLVPRSTRLTGCHAVLAPGPPKEVRVVQLIFRRYVRNTGGASVELSSCKGDAFRGKIHRHYGLCQEVLQNAWQDQVQPSVGVD
jgi:DNA invertase Pin-like site-specific DNA recombinase